MLLDIEKLLNVRIQIGIVLAVLFGYSIKKFLFRSEKWKSPFAKDSRTPLTPLVTDHAKRDETMKRAFTKKLANDTKWDAIVIGSGIGGLSTAALLSKAGMKVLVLEKHYKCGGACHIFKEEGYEFDVGIHYVGNFIRPTLTRTLLEQISDGQIQFAKFENNVERLVLNAMSPSQREYSIASGPDAFKNQLTTQFPDEAQGIKEFFRLLKRGYQPQGTAAWFAFKLLPLWFVNALRLLGLPRLLSDFYALGDISIKDAFKSNIKNKDVRSLLSYAAAGFLVPPDRVSLPMIALLHIHCCEYGSCYPIGGASEMPYRIIPVIERSGGRVLMKANVSQILTERGKVIGVRVGNKEKSMVDIYAPIVISDTGIHSTLIDLLPESVAKKSPAWPLTKTIGPSTGGLCVFVGLRGTPEELGLTAQNIWIYTGSDVEESLVRPGMVSTLPEILEKPYSALFLSSSASKDPSWKNRYPDRSTLSILTCGLYSWFEQWSGLPVNKRGEDYNTLKNAFGQKIVDQVTTMFPKLKNAVDYVCVGTPVTFEHYLNTRKGGTYNMEHDLTRFGAEQASLLRPESGIEGLYFSGQDVTSCGFASCLFSGFLCASTVLKKKYLLSWELFNLHWKLHGLPKGKNDLFF